MLADALSSGGLVIPELRSEDHDMLASMMHPGSSANNPVDLLATGTIEQLEKVIDYADREMPCIDAMIVIFGSNGMIDIKDIYELLHKKINECSKPYFLYFPLLPALLKSCNILLQKGMFACPMKCF
jgi:acetyltransferase